MWRGHKASRSLGAVGIIQPQSALITRDINQNRQYIKLTGCSTADYHSESGAVVGQPHATSHYFPLVLVLKQPFQCVYIICSSVPDGPQIILEPHTLYQIRKSSEIFVDPKICFLQPGFILSIQPNLNKRRKYSAKY